MNALATFGTPTARNAVPVPPAAIFRILSRFDRDEHRGSGPGCPLADPGGCEHDGRENNDDL